MSAEEVYGIIVLGFLVVLAVSLWAGFVGWVRPKGWREPQERI